MKKDEFLNKTVHVYILIGFTLLFFSFVLVATPIWPYVWYRINPNQTENDIENITKEVSNKQITSKQQALLDIPSIDNSLPEGKFVIIPKISVESPISTSTDYEGGLKQGTWIVPNYGTPENSDLPIILAAHRFGYADWSSEKRNKISFYNLPNTSNGDDIYIYWNQRKYVYKIYKSEESTYISDYSADLILYTCKFFNSPIRIFRYAERVQ